MKELLYALVKDLVSNPDAISIKESEKDGTLAFELSVAPDDMGRVIGKQGRVAKSIRTIMRSAAVRKGLSGVIVDIVD